jgi:hypothetical protein
MYLQNVLFHWHEVDVFFLKKPGEERIKRIKEGH